MSKNDIKNDPIRDFLINAIANFKENKIYILGFVAAIVITVAAFIRSSAPGADDSIYCYDETIKNSELFSEFCNSSDKVPADVFDFIQSISRILNQNVEDLSLEEKIAQMNNVKIESIDSNILKSLFFRELGEMYIDNNDYESALESFSNSINMYSDNKSFSADIFYKKAYSHYELGDFIKSKQFVERASNCDYDDPDLSDKINFLNGRLSYYRID